MADLSRIREHMEVIGADGVHLGTVDKVDGDRIKLIKADSGSHKDHHHYVSGGLVAEVEGNKVRLSANGDAAILLEEEEDGSGLGEDGLFSWRNIGIGAAAVAGVAAAAGAATLVRGRNSGGAKPKGKGKSKTKA
ncbi:MAG: hypothetical protein JWO81_1071 [Alphaproteobacteria bacterium]|nr:hypothetical protein [Alphaproteobacteria bacterium]